MTNADRIKQAAYLALGAIERIHDITSLEFAGHALINYERVVLLAPMEDYRAATALPDEDGAVVPGIVAMTERYLHAYNALYVQVHAPDCLEAM